MTLFELAHKLVWRTTWLHQIAGMQPGKPICMLQKHNPCWSLKFWSNCSWQSNNTKPLSLGPRASSHGVPSPTHVSKSKHGGKVPTIEPQQIIKVWFTSIKIRSWLFMQKNSQDLCWELGLPFCLAQFWTYILSLSSKKCCHVGIRVILGPWDPCEVISPNFHALNG